MPEAATLLALLTQLEQSQWFSPEQLLAMQFKQMQPLLQHAWQAIPFYRHRLEASGYNPGTPIFDIEKWSQIPVLTREEVQRQGDSLRSSMLPKGHGPGQPLRTSGSTGMPITVYRNNIDKLFWHLITLRDHLWHRRDIKGTAAIIRKLDNSETAPPPQGCELNSWGPPMDFVYQTGPAFLLDLGSTPINVQANWLLRTDPDWLLTYPTNAAALAKHFLEKGLSLPRLREIRTLSESVTEDTREISRRAWDVEITDMYSANEVGYIALQCPDQDHYHVQSECLLVEILNNNNEQCAPGEIGRVVVTTLHSYATPLIRYDIGDYAEVGHPCSCGRGLPVLKRIMGRSRNMLILPNGDQIWPVVRPSRYSEVAPVRQVQMIQHERDRIEVRLVVSAALNKEQEAALKKAIHESLGFPFKLDFNYLDSIPRTAGGKFEEFISKVEKS